MVTPAGTAAHGRIPTTDRTLTSVLAFPICSGDPGRADTIGSLGPVRSGALRGGWAIGVVEYSC